LWVLQSTPTSPLSHHFWVLVFNRIPLWFSLTSRLSLSIYPTSLSLSGICWQYRWKTISRMWHPVSCLLPICLTKLRCLIFLFKGIWTNRHLWICSCRALRSFHLWIAQRRIFLIISNSQVVECIIWRPLSDSF